MNRTRIIISIIMAAAALAIASCSELDLTEDAQLIDRNTSTAAPSTPVQQQAQGSTRTAVPTWEPVIPATNTPLTSTSFIGISPTATLDPVGTASGREEPGPGSATVNGLTEDEIIVLGEGVAEDVRRIYDRGQELERDPHAFSKLGDSLIATPNFFTQFDSGDYVLGEYDYLQPAIDYFAGSFERYGVALRPGLHAWAVKFVITIQGC